VPINFGGTHVIQKTRGAVLQSYLLKDRIVTTFGKREDDHFTKVYPNMAPASSFSDRVSAATTTTSAKPPVRRRCGLAAPSKKVWS